MNNNLSAHAFHKPRAHADSTSAQPLKETAHFASTHSGEHAHHIGGDHWSKKLALSFDIPTDYQAVTRKDYFEDHYVVIEPKRHLRPTDTLANANKIVETASSPRLDLQTEVDAVRDRNGNWRTKVVDNKFPALTLDNPHAFGKQEIVIDTPLNNTPLGEVDHSQLVAVLTTYQMRTKKLLHVPGIKYVTVFKNEGTRAGASLAHAHSQIFATPFIPENIIRTSQAAEAYFQKKSRNPYDELIRFERDQKERVVNQNDTFISLAPYASRWPLEVWVLPLTQIDSIVEMDNNQIEQLAQLLKPLIAKLSKYGVDYNFYLENGASPNHRFCLKIQPRSITNWGGFEVATNMILNPLPPETTATWYRS